MKGAEKSLDRVREELHLMVEYVDVAPRVELDFLRMHSEMLLGFILDAVLEKREKEAICA